MTVCELLGLLGTVTGGFAMLGMLAAAGAMLAAKHRAVRDD